MSQQSKDIERFYTYLDELEKSYGRLADLLRQKLAAVENFDQNKLDEIIKEEQVYVMLSRGFEGNIHSYRDKLKLSGSTLSEIVGELPQEEQPRFHQQHKRLQATLDTVKTLNEKCQQLIESKLYALDQNIQKLDKTGKNSTYAPGSHPKKPPEDGPRLFTKSI